MRHLLVFGHQRCRGDFGNHQARVKARLLGEERRQSVGEGRVDQKGDAALRDRADFADGKGNLVGCKGNRFGVEVATGNDGIIRQDQWVIRDRIGFDFERAGNRAQEIEAGTVDLRLAADAIGILNALVACRYGFPGSPSPQAGARRRRSRVDLALVATQRMDVRMERRRGTHGGISRKRAGDQRRTGRRGGRGTGRPEPGPSRRLGAVDQCQTFLGGENDRLSGRRAARRCAPSRLLAVARRLRLRPSSPQPYARAEPDRPTRRRSPFSGMTGMTPFVEHAFDQADDFEPDAGRAAAKRNEFQRHDQADDVFSQRLADAAAMRQDEIALQGGDIGRRRS